LVAELRKHAMYFGLYLNDLSSLIPTQRTIDTMNQAARLLEEKDRQLAEARAELAARKEEEWTLCVGVGFGNTQELIDDTCRMAIKIYERDAPERKARRALGEGEP
jgi:hypothetical protein